MSEEEEAENLMLVELADTACEVSWKKEEFFNENLELISNPKNAKSRKSQEKCQREHISH